MTTTTRREVLAASLATAAFAGRSARAQSKDPIKIGAVLSLSGPVAVFGIPERDAITVAANAINDKGGISGRKLEIVLIDDKSNPTDAARGVTQAASTDKVVAIIGPSSGSGILAAGPVAQRLQVPLLGPAGTIAITDKKNEFWPWIFRVAPSDRVDVKVVLQDMAKGGFKKIGVMYQEDAYGKTGLDYAGELSSGLGLDVVESASAPYTATDLTPQATRLRNAGVQAVFLQISIASLGVAFVKAAQQVGLTGPAYANAGLAQRSFAANAGAQADGLRVLSIGNIGFDPSPPEAELASLLRKAGKEPQGWGELVGSNGLMAAVAAARLIGDGPITGPAMRDALEKACGFPTYSRGHACFSPDNHDGWSEDSLTVTVVHDGQLKPLQG